MTEAPVEPRPSGVRRLLPAVLLLIGLAVLVRFPTSVQPGLAWTDPNSPLHAIAAHDLARGQVLGMLGGVESVGAPDGMTARILALPQLLLTAPLTWVLGMIPALNLGVLAWLLLCGLAAAGLARRLGGSPVLAAAALVVAPGTVLALGNGQIENLVTPALALAVLAGSASRPTAPVTLAAAAGACLLASSSSPYQGIVAWVLLLAVGLACAGRRALPLALAGAVGLLPAVAYFSAVLGDGLAPSAGPAPSALHQPASLGELFLGSLVGPGGGPEGSDPGVRSYLLLAGVEARPFDSRWPFLRPHTLAYLGLPLLVLGLWGLLAERRRPVVRGLLLGGGACALLALGSSLHLAPGVDTGLPLPWALAAELPALERLGVTTRFLPGLTLALALGTALWVSRRPRWQGTLAVTLLVLDGLWLAPVHWPVPALRAELPEELEELAAEVDGRLAIWPGPPVLLSHFHFLGVAVLDRPLAWFHGEQSTVVRGEVGTLDPETGRQLQVEGPAEVRSDRDLQGRSAEEWLEEARVGLVWSLHDREDPLRERDLLYVLERRSCEEEGCLWTVRPGHR